MKYALLMLVPRLHHPHSHCCIILNVLFDILTMKEGMYDYSVRSNNPDP